MSDELTHSESILVDAAPTAVYDVVSDVRRTGEWSPICVACWWADGNEPGAGGPLQGAWFHGRNVAGDRTWETRSLVATADRGHEFAWLVNGSLVRWGYLMTPEGSGTRLTESWHFLPAGIDYFREKFGADAEAQIDDRRRAALTGIPVTLAKIKSIIDAA